MMTAAPSVPDEPQGGCFTGVMQSDTRESKFDMIDVISGWCIEQISRDWFIELPSAPKIEILFVFRCLLTGNIEERQGETIIRNLLEANEAIEPYKLLSRMRKEDFQCLLRSQQREFTWRWNQIEDYVLLVSVIQGKLEEFQAATNRNQKATTRRFNELHRRMRLLMLPLPDVIVSESSLGTEEETMLHHEIGGEGEDASLTPTTGIKNMAAALFGKQIRELKKENKQKCMALCRMSKELYARNRKIESLEAQYVVEPTYREETRHHLQSVLDASMKHGTGRRYCDDVKQFWKRVYAGSPQSFCMLSMMFDGPSYSTVREWIKAEKVTLKAEITDIGKVVDIAKRWVAKHEKGVCYTLSYDACKIDEDIMINEKGNVKGVVTNVELPHEPERYKYEPALLQALWEEQILQKNLITHAFVFMLNPISTDRGYPIHVIFTNTGSANDQVLECIRQIPKLLADADIRVVFEASDSDSKYRMSFNKQFQWIFGQYSRIYDHANTNGSLNGLESINVPAVSKCNDIPHVLKRWRSRIINNQSLFLRYEDEISSDRQMKVVNVEGLRKINPEIPASAFRSGSLPAMDDAYPMMIFTKETLLKAFEAARLDFVVYLLPAVCANMVLRCKSLDRVRRMELSFLGWSMCIYYYSYLESLSASSLKFEHPLLTKELLVDLSNALFCHIYGIHTIANSYRLSKISSMISEHFFARMRRSMGPDQTAENFLSVLLRLVIVDSGTLDTNEEDIPVPRRSFDSALCEPGTCTLSEASVLGVRDFCSTIFRMMGMLLPPWAPHYSVFMQGQTVDLPRCLVFSWLSALQDKEKKQQKFSIHAGHARLPRIYGRSIKSRFVTAAKIERDSQ